MWTLSAIGHVPPSRHYNSLGTPFEDLTRLSGDWPTMPFAYPCSLTVTALQGRGFGFRCFRGLLKWSQSDQLLVVVQALNVDCDLSFKGSRSKWKMTKGPDQM